jgi:predicted nuclease with TOPRIM domain
MMPLLMEMSSGELDGLMTSPELLRLKVLDLSSALRERHSYSSTLKTQNEVASSETEALLTQMKDLEGETSVAREAEHVAQKSLDEVMQQRQTYLEKRNPERLAGTLKTQIDAEAEDIERIVEQYTGANGSGNTDKVEAYKAFKAALVPAATALNRHKAVAALRPVLFQQAAGRPRSHGVR